MAELITFRLGEQKFGIEVLRVKEILTTPKITPLPNSAEYVKGLLNIRGEVAPVIDLRIKFKTNNASQPLKDEIVITIKTQDGRMIGVVVDEVQNLENIEMMSLVSVPEFTTSIKKEFIKALAKHNSEMVAIMDIDRVLSKEELD